MAKLLISTQIRENYGSIEAPHWKSKGGSDYFIRHVDESDTIEILLYRVRDQIETDNPWYSEQIICANVVDDDYLTQDERLQLEFDGKITYPATEVRDW